MVISNGGFGPKIFSLDDTGWPDAKGGNENALECYLSYKWYLEVGIAAKDVEHLLAKRLPIAYGGCQYYYLLDCRTEGGPVLRFETNGLVYEDFHIMAFSLREWLESWLAGKEYRLPLMSLKDYEEWGKLALPYEEKDLKL